MRISVSIICFNEEKKIRSCLESVKWADEIVILDSYSTDKTLEICREFTGKIHRHEFDGHIQQKNRAIGLCSNDWVFCIDADEVVSHELCDSINKLNLSAAEYKGYAVPRKVFYIGKWIRHSGWYPDYKIRLFDRKYGRWAGINPHDTVIVNGSTGKLKGDLYHYSYSDVSAHLAQVNKFTGIMADEYIKAGKKASLLNLTMRPFIKFVKTYFFKLGFLDGWRGFIISIIGAFYVFMKFVKVFEKNVKQKY